MSNSCLCSLPFCLLCLAESETDIPKNESEGAKAPYLNVLHMKAVCCMFFSFRMFSFFLHLKCFMDSVCSLSFKCHSVQSASSLMEITSHSSLSHTYTHTHTHTHTNTLTAGHSPHLSVAASLSLLRLWICSPFFIKLHQASIS